LAALVPEVFPDCKITLRDGFVCGTPAQYLQPVRLFPAGFPALTVFNLFNGMDSIAGVSRQAAQQTGWTPEHSFAYVRGLFLYLVQARVCQPKSA